jgi:hypothetical protein
MTWMRRLETLGTIATLRCCKAISLIIIGVSGFVTGCKPETIWSAEARSPDGMMIATALASGANGFGNDGAIGTSVYLNWTTGSQPPTEILELGDATDALADTKVEMKWLSPKHLELTYGGNQIVGFQAVKWASVDISVRDLSGRRDASQK